MNSGQLTGNITMVWEEHYHEKVDEDFVLRFLLSILNIYKAANLGLSNMFSKSVAVLSSKEKNEEVMFYYCNINIPLMKYSGDTGLTP